MTHYFDYSFKQQVFQNKLAQCFATAIRNTIQSFRASGLEDRSIRVILFVHSHGAVLTQKALRYLTEQDRSVVEIFAFVGATMLPRSLARRVHNYVYDEDLISDLVNVRGSSSEEMVLYDVKRIRKEQREGKSEDEAIREIAYSNLYHHLSPLRSSSHESREVFEDKNRRYRRIFEEENIEALIADPYFQEKVNRYQALLRKYSIQILEGTSFQKPEFASLDRHANFQEYLGNLPGNLGKIVSNVATALFALGKHGNENHRFISYRPALESLVAGA